MNYYLVAVLVFLVSDFCLTFCVEMLNLKHTSVEVPEEFKDVYDQEKYKKSQSYLKDKTYFSLFQSVIMLPLMISVILFGGFNSVDLFVRSMVSHSLLQGALFFTCILGLSQLLGLPFSYYDHFVLEERYGFNTMTKKTFFSDLIKSFLLFLVIGLPLLMIILWFFESAGGLSWLYCWIIVTVFQLVMMFLAPTLIMPLFNTFEPVEEGDLKTAIETYANQQSFSLAGVFKMDGSKRSSKANAFFTGFGKFRRIVLFDTLIENYSVAELVCILAHEMGHFKKKHIVKMIVSSVIQSFVMFYVLHLFLNNRLLFDAFNMTHVSVYGSLLFFGFLYSPLSQVLSIVGSWMSRKHEFEADRYAIETTSDKDSFISALKKLSVDTLSNLTPHPLKVFLEYSHPPVIQRINAIRNIQL